MFKKNAPSGYNLDQLHDLTNDMDLQSFLLGGQNVSNAETVNLVNFFHIQEFSFTLKTGSGPPKYCQMDPQPLSIHIQKYMLKLYMKT